MQLKEYIQKKVIKMLGLIRYEGSNESERLTLVNDRERINQMKVREYNVWYEGDDDELLNFYTKNNLLDFNYEPYYNRNKLNYFWAISSTENDIKRTHSGHPRNIVDTLVNVVGEGMIDAAGETTNSVLDTIIEDNDFHTLVNQEQLPYTLVEGWGAFKINWDLGLSDTPIILYYKANDVDFVMTSNRVVGIIFKDYFINKDAKRFLITETRYIGRDEKAVKGRSLYIEKELFELSGDNDILKKVRFKDYPEFEHIKSRIRVKDYDKLLAVPSIIFKNKKNSFGDMPGKSIFCGKISFFDDIDQAWSQLSNTTRKSTPVEYIDVNYLERDKKTGVPIMPKAYDRKYTKLVGARNSDGETRSDPVQVTQPELKLNEFLGETTQLLQNSIAGILSPATLGIDVGRRDNADAQREKEKVTIFTRNAIIKKESRILKAVLEQAMHAYELMHTNQITIMDYEISVKFSEFADDSFDSKLAVLGEAFGKGVLSPEMLVDRLYANEELSDEERQREIDYIKENSKDPFQEGFNPDGSPDQAVQPGQSEDMFGGLDENEDSEDL